MAEAGATADGTTRAALLLAIDIGNTSIAIGVYEGERLRDTFRIATDRDNLPDEYGVLLLGLLGTRGVRARQVGAAVVSSTVPQLEQTFSTVCRAYFDVEPLVVGTGVRTGVPIRYDNPREVGADRILHAVAALARYDPPLVIVDLGTALVFDAVSAQGEYLGGAIAPGIGIASEALFQRAAMLRRVAMQRPPQVVGRNTVHSLQSGLYYGYVDLIAGMVTRFRRELGGAATVIGTGGYAAALAPDLDCLDAIEEHLNLDGLRLVWERNR